MENNLPNGWVIIPLEKVVDIFDRQRIPLNATERSIRQGPFPYYGANGQVDSIDDFIYDGEYVLLAEDGGFFDQPGRGVAYTVKGKFWVNNHAHVLGTLRGMPTGFLVNQLNSIDWMPYVSGTTRLKLNQGSLKKVPLKIPPLNEQKRIASKIETLQARSKKTKKALEIAKSLLDKLRQSILASAFRGDLTADWRKKNPDVEPAFVLLERIRVERRKKWEQAELAKMRTKGKEPKNDKWKSKYKEPTPVKTTDLPELPRGWVWATIEDLVSLNKPGIKTGPFGSLLKKNEHKPEGIPVLGIENIGKMVFIPGPKIHISEKKAVQLKDYSIDSGDLIVSRSGTVGEVCVIPDNIGICRFSTNIIRVSLYGAIMRPELMGYQFIGSEIVKKQIAKLCSGSTRDFLNKTIMTSIVFPVPPIEEQKQIIEKIRSLLLKRDSIRKMLDTCYQESDKLNQSILLKAFRGELVSQNSLDEPASELLERIKGDSHD